MLTGNLAVADAVQSKSRHQQDAHPQDGSEHKDLVPLLDCSTSSECSVGPPLGRHCPKRFVIILMWLA